MLSNSFEALNAICFNSLEPIDYHPLQKSGDSRIASFIFIFCWDHGSRVLTKQITVGSFGKKLRFVERPNQTKSSKKNFAKSVSSCKFEDVSNLANVPTATTNIQGTGKLFVWCSSASLRFIWKTIFLEMWHLSLASWLTHNNLQVFKVFLQGFSAKIQQYLSNSVDGYLIIYVIILFFRDNFLDCQHVVPLPSSQNTPSTQPSMHLMLLRILLTG